VNLIVNYWGSAIVTQHKCFDFVTVLIDSLARSVNCGALHSLFCVPFSLPASLLASIILRVGLFRVKSSWETLKTEGTSSSETSITNSQSTPSRIPEDSIVHEELWKTSYHTRCGISRHNDKE
jgi:hypothetical protein